jgi:hypothetical protein
MQVHALKRSTALTWRLSPQYAVPDEVDDATAAQFTVSIVLHSISNNPCRIHDAGMLQVRASTSSWQVNPLTVIGMLERVAVPRGEWLLQTAAGSTLGRLVRLRSRIERLVARVHAHSAAPCLCVGWTKAVTAAAEWCLSLPDLWRCPAGHHAGQTSRHQDHQRRSAVGAETGAARSRVPTSTVCLCRVPEAADLQKCA